MSYSGRNDVSDYFNEVAKTGLATLDEDATVGRKRSDTCLRVWISLPAPPWRRRVFGQDMLAGRVPGASAGRGICVLAKPV